MKNQLALTPEQTQQRQKAKTEEFLKLMEEAENKTGMRVVAVALYSPTKGLYPDIAVVEKESVK